MTGTNTLVKGVVNALINGLVILLAAILLRGVGVSVTDYWAAFMVGILLTILDLSIGAILKALTFPLSVMTFGLVSFVINVLMILLADALMTSFDVAGFWSAALLAIVISLIRLAFGIGDRK